MRYGTPKEIPVVFLNGSTCDYHYLINELAKKIFEGQFEYLEENSEKYITFSVLLQKELDSGKTVAVAYKLRFFDSFRFISSLLSSLVDNLSEGIHNKKCKECKSCLEYLSTENNELIFKCINCNKNYKLNFDKDVVNRFASTYEFCDKNLNKFIFLLRKGVIPIISWIFVKDLMKDYCLIRKILILI